MGTVGVPAWACPRWEGGHLPGSPEQSGFPAEVTWQGATGPEPRTERCLQLWVSVAASTSCSLIQATGMD